MWISHHTSQSCLSSCPHTSTLSPCNLPQKKKKLKKEESVVEVAVWPLEPHSLPSSSFIISLHYYESLVSFEAGFCYTTRNGFSMGLLLDIPLLSRAMEILQFWIYKFIPSQVLTVSRFAGYWGGLTHGPSFWPAWYWASLPCFTHLYYPGKLSSIASTSSSNAA